MNSVYRTPGLDVLYSVGLGAAHWHIHFRPRRTRYEAVLRNYSALAAIAIVACGAQVYTQAAKEPGVVVLRARPWVE